MTRIAIPVLERTLRSTGDVLLRVEVELLLRTNQGGWEQETFLVDTGTELSTFPAALARKLDLPMPVNPAVVAVHAQTGLALRSGLLRFRVVGMDQTEYVMPCFFLGDPHLPHAGPAATAPRKLFQPCSVTKHLRFTFDDANDPALPHGELVVEQK